METCLQSSAQGTFNYMAPEQFEEDISLTPKADVWAFACTFIHMVTGEAPMGRLIMGQIVHRVSRTCMMHKACINLMIYPRVCNIMIEMQLNYWQHICAPL